MKILEINSVCGTGSTGRIACQIAETVVRHGGDATVAYGRSLYPEGCNVPTYRIGSKWDAKIHAGLSRLTDRQGFYSTKATRKLVDFIKRDQPDIIHLHNLHGYYLNIRVLFNFLAIYNKPVVWTLHDCWAFTGHCAYFDFVNCYKWTLGCYQCPQKNKYPKSLLLDQSKRNWKQKKHLFTSIKNMSIITPSHWLADLVKQSFLGKYPVTVINNGIDLNVFCPTESSWKEDHGISKPMVLACAAVWGQRKGFGDVIKLAEIVTDLYGVLEENGHNCLIAYGGLETTTFEGKTYKIGSRHGIYWHGIQTRIFDNHGFSSKKDTTKLITIIKEYEPDIIHLHNIHGYYLNIKMLFTYLANVDLPVIWTLHSCWPFTGHCTYFDYIGCEKWKSCCFKCPQKNNYPASKFFDNSKNNYLRKKNLFPSLTNMTLVTPSRWLAELVGKSFMRDYPIKVIHNGIDLRIFKPTCKKALDKNGLKEKFLILGVAHQWTERKGIKYFIQLAERISKDCQIVLVGSLCNKKQNFPKNITIINGTNDVNELAELYSSADVFVNPTLEDNFPTTNLEALACGTPVITFKTGGSPESIDDNCGIVVDKGDLDGLVEAIELLKSNNKELLAVNCINRARIFFDKNRQYQKYVELFEKLVK